MDTRNQRGRQVRKPALRKGKRQVHHIAYDQDATLSNHYELTSALRKMARGAEDLYDKPGLSKTPYIL